MASLTPIYIRPRAHDGLDYVLVLLRNTTAADTATIAAFDDIVAVTGVRLDTGAVITPTEATNVVTIPSGPSSTDLLILVTGT